MACATTRDRENVIPTSMGWRFSTPGSRASFHPARARAGFHAQDQGFWGDGETRVIPRFLRINLRRRRKDISLLGERNGNQPSIEVTGSKVQAA